MEPHRLPPGFRVYFYDEDSCDTVACPRDYRIKPVGRSQFLFYKGDIAYGVDLEEGTCTCQDFLIRNRGRRGCKHLRLAKALEAANGNP